MTYDFGNYEADAITKPRDLCWDNWFKFENVGDLVQGFIVDVFFRESDGDFPEQRGITLLQPDGELINVGIKYIDFVLAKTNDFRLGDPLTVKFEKAIPPTVKGHSPTKQMGFYGKALERDARQANVSKYVKDVGDRTVLQLEKIERKEFDKAAEQADADFMGEELTNDTSQVNPPAGDFTPGDSKPEAAPAKVAPDSNQSAEKAPEAPQS